MIKTETIKPWSVSGLRVTFADALGFCFQLVVYFPLACAQASNRFCCIDFLHSRTISLFSQWTHAVWNLSWGEKPDDTGLWETCEGFNMFQTAKRAFIQKGKGREKGRGRKEGLGGHNRQKMLSIRPEDSWGWGSQLRLSLSIMQYTSVPLHGLIHFSATSDMEDLHLRFLLVFSGSWGRRACVSRLNLESPLPVVW